MQEMQYTPEQIAAMNAQFNQAQYSQPVQYTQDSIDDLFDAAAEDLATKGKPQEGVYAIRLTDTSWHISDNEKMLGNVGPQSGMPKLTFVHTDGPRSGKKYTKHFWLGSSHQVDGRSFNGENDWLQFLIKHGFSKAQLNAQIKYDPITGVRNKKESYAGIIAYLKNYGGDYSVEFRKNKNNPEKMGEYFRTIPVLFDQTGNAIPKPVAPLIPVAQQPAPMAPVPTAVAPVIPQMPVQQFAPVAVPQVPVQAPVQQFAPVAPVTPVVPQMPVAPAIPQMQMPAQVEQAPVFPTTPVAPAIPSFPSVPAGLPGLPGLPTFPV